MEIVFHSGAWVAHHVREAVRQREGELLRGGRPRFADVIARDGNRVPQRRVSRAPLEHIDDDLERGLDRIHPGVLRHVFLEDVVLHRAAERMTRNALPLGRRHVEAEQQRRRPVDRHGRGDLVERDAAEQVFHVGERRDRDAALPHLTFGARMIGVVAHQRREVEGDRQAGLAVLEQELVPLIGVFRRPEAGELPHRPQPPAIHGGVNPAGERVLARRAELTGVIEAGEISGGVQGLPLDVAHRGAPAFTWSRISAATS